MIETDRFTLMRQSQLCNLSVCPLRPSTRILRRVSRGLILFLHIWLKESPKPLQQQKKLIEMNNSDVRRAS